MPRKKKIEKEEPRKGMIAHWFGDGSEHVVLAITHLVLALFITLSLTGTAGLIGVFVAEYLDRFFGLSVYLLLSVILLSALGIARGTKIAKVLFGSTILYFAGTLLLEAYSKTTLAGVFGGWFYTQVLFLIGPILTVGVGLLLIFIGVAFVFNLRLNAVREFFIHFLAERKNTQTEEDDESPVYDNTEDGADTNEYDELIAEDEDDNDATIENKEEYAEEGSPKILPLATLPYKPPHAALLDKETSKPRPGDIKANTNLIKRTLQNFGINVEMDEVSIGPSITRYAMKPAEGVKLSKIVGLQDNLAMALAAHPLRIEAPIPGKSLVGIEIPNSTRSLVGLGQLLSTKEFLQGTKHLPFALGRNVSGSAVYADMAKAPHLLVAGATGSGKSVTIHCLIQSFLFKHGPGMVRMLMIDPKRVELTLYNNIPHLLAPVITDAKKAILALKWAAKEMERRYDILESFAVRDIQSYHENVFANKKDGENELDQLPYIVIVIDELADIMSSYPRELEAAIVRLAQKSRAVGIHLIISTQRPSTDVITGLIKANIPARIALQVPSQIDSRTIIDMPGAEKLLGAGDMLYLVAI